TQIIRDLFAERNFQAVISYHSYSQVILYPWGYTNQPTTEQQLLDQIAADMSGLIQSVNGNIYEYGQAAADLYLTNGGMIDWTFGTYNIPSYTLELPPIDQAHGGFFNAEEDIQPIFNENLPAMLYLIDWSVQNFSSGINPSRRRERRSGPIANMKDKNQYGREARARREDKDTTQNSKLKTNEPKTSGVKNKTIDIGNKAINVRKYSPMFIKEHKRK
ncbi:MAG TPA: hypothetical protein ENH65_13330, partial [Candidatus Aminicenantes bacterium]|nr:hypothetical protein [Candidatus Aminicenantes bacterium]